MQPDPDRYSWLVLDPKLQPMRSRVGGLLLLVAAPIVGGGGIFVILWLTAYFFDLTHGDTRCIYFGGAFCVLPVMGAGRLLRIGRGLRQEDAIGLLRRDRRAPIIYLRPFFEDQRVLSNEPAGKMIGGGKLLRNFGEVGFWGGLFNLKTRASLETVLSHAFRHVGPFVAIGRPGDFLAPDGAARVYVAHKDWQETVARLVKLARAVVFQPEITEGAMWELNHIANRKSLRQVLVIVPNPSLRPLGYKRVRDVTARELPTPLPLRPPPCDAFMFDEAGVARPLIIGRDPTRELQPFLDQIADKSEGSFS